MIFSVVTGVVDAGFTTTVFPAMSAGPIFVPMSVMGKFLGTMAAHTPTAAQHHPVGLAQGRAADLRSAQLGGSPA